MNLLNPSKEFTIALVGPIETAAYLDILKLPKNQPYPKGTGGSPVNLLALELYNRGYNLLLCSEDPTVENEVTLQGDRLKIRYVHCRKRPARTLFSQESKRMTQILKEEQPDFIHAHWTYEYAIAAENSGIPYLITAHDAPINVLKLNFIPFRIARTLMAYIAVWKAKQLSAVSPYVADHLKKFLLYKKPITIIPNGMPNAIFSRVKSNRGGNRILTFASILTGWSGYKNGEAVIKAFDIFRNQNKDIHSQLLMFGTGHGKGEEAEQWATKLGINQDIQFIGQIPYESLIPQLNNEVDILVHPALEEAQPMSLIEAMAMQIPVIGGKYSGGVPWTLDYGKAGILVDVNKPEEIAEAMSDLANNPTKRETIGLAGFELAKKRFHISVVTDAYIDNYHSILSTSKK